MRTLFEIVTEKGTAEDIRGLMSRKDRIEAAADALDSREGKFLDPESRAILIRGHSRSHCRKPEIPSGT